MDFVVDHLPLLAVLVANGVGLLAHVNPVEDAPGLLVSSVLLLVPVTGVLPIRTLLSVFSYENLLYDFVSEPL